jgi:hypothetical protein
MRVIETFISFLSCVIDRIPVEEYFMQKFEFC